MPPAALATINHAARAARPQAIPAPASPECCRHGAGLRRAAAARAGRALAREPAFDLLVRFPDRALVALAVLLAIAASLTAIPSLAPSATLATARVARAHPRGTGHSAAAYGDRA
ncbi:hypothetical protein MALGJ_21880 [Mycolicibacter algericus]|uniref:Uncharacterized protein n=1 Tax=Mycolicibacter algericus TaxID=1288388 RepID=A0A7I9YAI5_MYCAL|nr:hypothetical protein MALGJ_21880 [Mycolicibacter algericus]